MWLEMLSTLAWIVNMLKIITSPVYMARRQVDWRTLGIMLAGGVPGVLIGVFVLRGAPGYRLPHYLDECIQRRFPRELLKTTTVASKGVHAGTSEPARVAYLGGQGSAARGIGRIAGASARDHFRGDVGHPLKYPAQFSLRAKGCGDDAGKRLMTNSNDRSTCSQLRLVRA